jgi:hypothetical protein
LSGLREELSALKREGGLHGEHIRRLSLRFIAKIIVRVS